MLAIPTLIALTTTQLVVVNLATRVGRTAGTWGRKPLLLIAFGALPVQGAIGAAVGTGAALSQVAAGSMAHYFGNNAGFLFLAAIASLAFVILFFFMPETLENYASKPSSATESLPCS